ncbi:MAG: hypothetical protein J7518_10510 [Nocardioidaceae bacterium]|nr:hypothetical protein [Nocardioidaceae bacterium]
MAESPEALYARILDAVGPDGRLPLSSGTTWDIFPWEVADGALATKTLLGPVEAEEPRHGEDGTGCDVCEGRNTERRIWENDAWTVSALERSGLLILMLEPREHLDYTDLDDAQAADLGRISVWLTRIMSNLEHVGRVHVMRIGDGAAHLHLWHIARPERFPQLRGSFVVEWDDVLPAVPEEIWRADLAHVAKRLAQHDGRALV